MRRILLAFTISVGVHLGVLVGAVAVGLWGTLSLAPSLKVQTIAIDVVKDLPLGAPPDKQPEPPPLPVRPRRPKVRVASTHEGVTVPAAPDAGVPEPKTDAATIAKGVPHDAGAPHDAGSSIDGGRRRPGDLRKSGPEGSRVIALLRLDRLRASPDSDNTIAAVDRLLALLPDRHRLIDGTGLDLYRDFDSLLIATPNPVDDTVTFLAARHHLTDAALKAGLDRAAKAAQKPIAWRNLEGRPVGIRQKAKNTGTAREALDRDDRILVLPQPSLALMATPAYAALLLGRDVTAQARASSPVDAGGVDAGRELSKAPGRPNWPEIAERIEAEDSAMPDDAAFMLTAANLFGTSTGEGFVVPSTRGANEDSPPQRTGSGAGPVPVSVTLVAGAETPFIEILAEFKTSEEADKFESQLPAWKRKLVTNPMVILGGFSSLVGRAEITREENTLQVRVASSTAELQRLLNVIGNLARTALVRPQ
jgi:hypothetical protein